MRPTATVRSLSLAAALLAAALPLCASTPHGYGVSRQDVHRQAQDRPKAQSLISHGGTETTESASPSPLGVFAPLRERDSRPVVSGSLAHFRTLELSNFSFCPFRFQTKYWDAETGLYYFGFRYYDPLSCKWLCRDPKGEAGGVNLTAYCDCDPVNGHDPLGLTVYAVYRQLGIPGLGWTWYTGRLAGHVYLAFDDKDMGVAWQEILKRHGYSKTDIPNPQNYKEYNNWLTFSFHPWSVKMEDSTGNRVSVVYTEGSWIDINNSRADIRPIEDDRVIILPITTDETQQIKMFEAVQQSANINRASLTSADHGNYSFAVNNCADWAQWITRQSGLSWPGRAYLWNGGTAVGGPLDYTLLPQITYGVSFAGYHTYRAVKVAVETAERFPTASAPATGDERRTKNGRSHPMAILTNKQHVQGNLMFILFCLASSGCTIPQGLVRTQLDAWETKQFPGLGFNVEIPKQPIGLYAKYYLNVYDSQKIEDRTGYKSVDLCLHPIWSGSLLVEPHYLIEINFSRMTETRLQQRKDTAFTNTFYSVIETTQSPSPFDKEKWRYLRFRKDYRMGNGYVLVCDAKLLRMTDKEDTDYRSDTNAIYRVLNSAKPDVSQAR
jgi:RHS repeat-associated protein